MQSLNFDDGYKSFAINNDESRVIRFNPSDPNQIQRYDEALKKIMAAKDKIGEDIQLTPDGSVKAANDLEFAAKVLRDADNVVRESLNYMFNSDVYDVVFAGQSPFCMIKGRFLLEHFLSAVGPVITQSSKEAAAASERRMGKYLNKPRRKRR